MAAAWGHEEKSRMKPMAEPMCKFLRIDKVLKVGTGFSAAIRCVRINSHRW
jgi:hypothetical protein